MANFQDRRDSSDPGLVRRQRFAALMDMLVKKGAPRYEARRELLKVLHGDSSALISALLGEVDLA
jgi:hypothetical protein